MKMKTAHVSWRPAGLAALVLMLTGLSLARGQDKAADRDPAMIEAATRLQVFLDLAEFAPGKIDGRYGEFTTRALALYREAHGLAQPSAHREEKVDSAVAPDVRDLDLKTVEPVFVDYTVTEQDLKTVGDLPESITAQAKAKWLPYQTALEAIAEKFHSDARFIAELNPDKTESIKAGEVLRVPNVKPFELSTISNLEPGVETVVEEPESEPQNKVVEKKREGTVPEPSPAKSKASVVVDSATNMLTVRDGEKLLAAYPVTIGSERTQSPVGDWTVKGVARFPKFRYDKSMLNKGERSDDFHLLPPGPNNLVGVIWIQLNKKGIGLHGTNEPDTIGRGVSHGCVRLANWDIARLATKVKAGVPVTIK